MTDPEPFNITQKKEKPVTVKPVPNSTKPLSSRKRAQKSIDKTTALKESVLTPRSQLLSSAPMNSPSKTVNLGKKEEDRNYEKYAKLRIHYAKDKSAEIKVYESTDAEDLAEQFCKKYSLAPQMQKHLFSIIQNKLESLRSLQDVELQDLTKSDTLSEKSKGKEEEKFFTDDQNPIATDSLNEDLPNDVDEYDDDEDMRDSSSIPVPEKNTHNETL